MESPPFRESIAHEGEKRKEGEDDEKAALVDVKEGTKMWFWRKMREKPESKKHELMIAMADGPDRKYPMVMADGDIREIAGLMGQTLGVIGRWAAESEGQDEKVAYDLLLDIVKKNMENARAVEIMSNYTGEQWLFYYGLR